MIKIYTSPNCFHCLDAKKKLKEKGIEFEELDGAENIDYLTTLNQFSMPVIIRDGEVVKIEDIIK